MEPKLMRQQIREVYSKALSRVSVEAALRDHVEYSDDMLCIGDHRYRIAEFHRVLVVSIGKAAVQMCNYFVRLLAPHMAESKTLTCIVSGPSNGDQPPRGALYFAGGHPVPNIESQNAAERVVSELRNLAGDSLVLFLISGGASAMMEKPLDPAFSVADSAALHRELVHSGLAINEMNVVRKHFSAVKGGRLATIAGNSTQCSVLISDVAGDVPHLVGSGPSLPDPSTRRNCVEILERSRILERLPKAIQSFFQSHDSPETPKPGDPEFAKSSSVTILSNQHLLKEASSIAQAAGYHVVVDNTCDDWPVEAAADYLLSRLWAHRKSHTSVCLLSGGEVTVKLPDSAGIGGRNQHFALYCATQLSPEDDGVAVLSAGSDGVDGNSPAAGAIVDWTTRDRAKAVGLDLKSSLKTFDSYCVFQALGDSIVTGLTGNNLRDIRMLISSPSSTRPLIR